MRIILAAAVAVLLVAQASAQNAGAPAPAKSATAPKPAAGNAPVGHRQPTQAEIGKQDNLAPSAEDKELDRKIKGICRGC